MFLSHESLKSCTWQSLERNTCRVLLHANYTGIRHVGQPNDGGADIIAHKAGKRWLFQVKRWNKPISLSVVDETVQALSLYRAHVPVIVALKGFDSSVHEAQRELLSRQIPLQLWDSEKIVQIVSNFKNEYPLMADMDERKYQQDAISNIVREYQNPDKFKSLVVMATGMGKTFVAGESLRRIERNHGPKRILFVVHTNELVYQLEKSIWRFLKPDRETLVWNGYERPELNDIDRSDYLFCCLHSLYEHIKSGGYLPEFDLMVIDECHHIGGRMYLEIIQNLQAGEKGGPYLIGLTATPWRPDETDFEEFFGTPTVCVDMVTGLKKGFLSNVDYRMFTDNIDWDNLKNICGENLTPKGINRTLFITEWDDAVVFALKKAWNEHENPKAIVFCGTVDHAITMRDRINALRFCNAASIFSQTASGYKMTPFERNCVLCDFADGKIDVVCAVDIFNEGIDVPDVNVVVFQRVTHSRRIFIQQLGRGLRLSKGKEKVIVLDFVSDIRRFAAGISLKDKLSVRETPIRVELNHQVTFKKIGSDDPEAESFLREWLDDVAAVENAGDDTSILKFPPTLE